MTTFWGVDSANPASSKVAGIPLYDYVTQQAGSTPSFWGRYIGGRYSVTSGEVAFLHSKGCKVLVVYNGTHNSVSSVQGGLAEGTADAQKAVVAAQNLAVPANVCIYADIETGWGVTVDWFKGWAITVKQAGYKVGFYGNPVQSNAPYFDHPYGSAYSSEQSLADSLVFSSEPEPGCSTAGNAPAFAPRVPSCNSAGTVIWQYAENCFSGQVDQDLAIDAGFAAMW
ncbi:MAG: glycoside hydrolase domain-containing protein [Candidatus Acidiferrum sp.]